MQLKTKNATFAPKATRIKICVIIHRQQKQGIYPAFVVLSSLIMEDSNLGEAQPSLLRFAVLPEKQHQQLCREH